MNMSGYPLMKILLLDDPDETTQLRAEFEDNYYRALDEMGWIW
jgi:hypothetical protein